MQAEPKQEHLTQNPALLCLGCRGFLPLPPFYRRQAARGGMGAGSKWWRFAMTAGHLRQHTPRTQRLPPQGPAVHTFPQGSATAAAPMQTTVQQAKCSDQQPHPQHTHRSAAFTHARRLMQVNIRVLASGSMACIDLRDSLARSEWRCLCAQVSMGISRARTCAARSA
jgi:hypothetical protein